MISCSHVEPTKGKVVCCLKNKQEYKKFVWVAKGFNQSMAMTKTSSFAKKARKTINKLINQERSVNSYQVALQRKSIYFNPT